MAINTDRVQELRNSVQELEDIKMKAEKVFAMGNSNKDFKYVLEALQYAIDVGQGKSPSLPASEKKEELFAATKDLATNAMGFHNKFAKLRAEAAKSDVAEDEQEQDQSKKLGG